MFFSHFQVVTTARGCPRPVKESESGGACCPTPERGATRACRGLGQSSSFHSAKASATELDEASERRQPTPRRSADSKENEPSYSPRLRSLLPAVAPLSAPVHAQPLANPSRSVWILALTGARRRAPAPRAQWRRPRGEDHHPGGGIDGRPIQLIIEDDGSNPDGAISKANNPPTAKGVCAIGSSRRQARLRSRSIDPLKMPRKSRCRDLDRRSSGIGNACCISLPRKP